MPGTGRALVPRLATRAAHHPAGLPGSPHHKAGSPLPAQIPASGQEGLCCSALVEQAFHRTSLASPGTVRVASEGSQAQTLPAEDSALTFMS